MPGHSCSWIKPGDSLNQIRTQCDAARALDQEHGLQSIFPPPPFHLPAAAALILPVGVRDSDTVLICDGTFSMAARPPRQRLASL